MVYNLGPLIGHFKILFGIGCIGAENSTMVVCLYYVTFSTEI
jgi:hypothetical protein